MVAEGEIDRSSNGNCESTLVGCRHVRSTVPVADEER
jgi:hypothetical protein